MSDTISILLVDDEQRNLDALEAILDDAGYRLLRAEDADKALRLLLENDVAAIVLDIKMPGISGFELANLIKGTKKFRQIPIVFLTAHLLDDQDVLTGYGAGAVDYLTKPVNPQILRHKISVFADLFRKTRALAELNENLETRVRERTAELERSRTALEEAGKQKDLFLATLAHELRNPLAPLRTGLDLLLEQPDASPLAVRAMTAMNRQLDHMVRLVDDLLDISRISRGTLDLRKEAVDLRSVVQSAIEMVDPVLKRHEQTVVVNAEGPFPMRVDPTRVAQIVGNLLNNASKHSPAGTTIRIDLRCERDRGVMRVVDEGIGIPPHQLARVFDMFTKVERPAQKGANGLGVGLALSRRLAELHGGTLTAASDGDGKGATFTLELPLGGLEPVVASSVKPMAPSAIPQVLRIVIVEDNNDSAEMMHDWLSHLGHEVRVARTGPDGIAAIFETRPDVVLCDIGLPEVDGVEVCRRVMAGMPAPPVMVALTGWGMDADRKRTQEAGFRFHLVKPIAPKELRSLLQSIGQKAQTG